MKNLKNALWKAIERWNYLLRYPQPEHHEVDCSNLQKRVAHEQEMRRRRAEERFKRVAQEQDARHRQEEQRCKLELQATDSLRKLYQRLTDESEDLPLDSQKWIGFQLIEAEQGSPTVVVDLHWCTRLPTRLSTSAYYLQGKFKYRLVIARAGRQAKEASYDSLERLSEVIETEIARHIAKHTANLAPEKIAAWQKRDQTAQLQTVQALFKIAEQLLEEEVEDPKACFSRSVKHDSLSIIFPPDCEDDPHEKIVVSVLRLHPGPAGLLIKIDEEPCGSLERSAVILKTRIDKALHEWRAADAIGSRTYSEGVARGEYWGRVCSVQESEGFIASYGEQDYADFLSAEKIFEAVYPDAEYPWPDYVEPRESEITAAKWRAELAMGEFWDVDPEEAGRIPSEYLRGFVEGAQRSIRKRRQAS